MSSRRKRVTVVGASVVAPTKPTLTAPGAGDVYPGVAVTVSATVTAGQVPDRIDFVLDPGASEVVVATDSASPYSQSWVPAQAVGDHTIVARFVYGSGHVDSDPTSITIFDAAYLSGLVLNLDAALGITQAGGLVSAWTDQSSSAHSATAAGATRPTYSASGMGSTSTPYLLSDGVNNVMSMVDSADWNFGSGTYAVFAVMRFVSGSGGFQVLGGQGSDTADSAWRLFRLNTNKLALYANGGLNYTPSTLTVADGTDFALMWGYDAVDAKVLYAKGATRERTAVTLIPVPDGTNAVKLFNDNTPGYPSNARLGQMVVYKRSAATHFTDAEAARVLTWLQAKHGV